MNEFQDVQGVEIRTVAPQGLTLVHRGLLVGGALAIFVVFAIAARLTPNPSGMGTHQQLGLPPCSFQFFLSLPCPTCGFTTTWTLIMHGRWWEAVQTNLGGVMLWLLAAFCGVWMFVSGLRGAWFICRLTSTFFALTLATIALTTFLIWLGRLINAYFG